MSGADKIDGVTWDGIGINRYEHTPANQRVLDRDWRAAENAGFIDYDVVYPQEVEYARTVPGVDLFENGGNGVVYSTPVDIEPRWLTGDGEYQELPLERVLIDNFQA